MCDGGLLRPLAILHSPPYFVFIWQKHLVVFFFPFLILFFSLSLSLLPSLSESVPHLHLQAADSFFHFSLSFSPFLLPSFFCFFSRTSSFSICLAFVCSGPLSSQLDNEECGVTLTSIGLAMTFDLHMFSSVLFFDSLINYPVLWFMSKQYVKKKANRRSSKSFFRFLNGIFFIICAIVVLMFMGKGVFSLLMQSAVKCICLYYTAKSLFAYFST